MIYLRTTTAALNDLFAMISINTHCKYVLGSMRTNYGQNSNKEFANKFNTFNMNLLLIQEI